MEHFGALMIQSSVTMVPNVMSCNIAGQRKEVVIRTQALILNRAEFLVQVLPFLNFKTLHECEIGVMIVNSQ